MATSKAKPKIVYPYIRWMIRCDMPEVLAIENESFPDPWRESEFIDCLRQRNCIGMVVEVDASERIAGSVIYELHKTRLEILNFAVGKQFRRQGIGKAMIAKLIGKLSPGRRERITMDIRESNLEALAFLRSQGFRATRILRNYWRNTDDDAYAMEYRFNEFADPTNRIAKYQNT